MKNKRKENLNIENRAVGCRSYNKIGIVVIAFLLLAAGVNATIRLKDPSGSTPGYWGDGSVITNSNGKSWAATGANIQVAIWDLNNTGGDVYIPSGTYNFGTNGISIDKTLDGLHLIGTGIVKPTIFVLTSATPDYILRIHGTDAHCSNMSQYITIENIVFRGAGYSTPLVVVENASYIQFYNCRFSNSNMEAIRFLTVWGSKVHNCYIGVCGNYTNSIGAITYDESSAGDKCTDVVIESTNFFNCSYSYISCADGKAADCCINKNYIETPSGGNQIANAINWQGYYGVISNNIIHGQLDLVNRAIFSEGYHTRIDNNYINSCKKGILAALGYCIIVNNELYATNDTAIEIGNSYQVVSGNIIRVFGIDGTYGGSGIKLSSSCSYCSVTGNTINNGQTSAYGIWDSGDNNTIMANTIEGGSISNGLMLSGENAFASGNIISDATNGINNYDDDCIRGNIIDGVFTDYIKTMITNSNGKSWAATGANIQLAIDDLSSSGTVWLPGDTTISVSTTITVPAKITLDLGNCIITNGADVDLFKMYQDSKIINGRIEATGAFTSDVINVTETFSFTNLTIVENINIRGDVGAGNGNAIHLYASTTDYCISNFQMHNAYIRGFENSILLTTYDNTWISANMFDNIWIDAPVYGIRLIAYGSSYPHSNTFTNIVIQCNGVTICGVIFDEYNNCFQGQIQDWSLPYVVDNTRFAVYLAGSGHIIDAYVSHVTAQTINDTGYGNTIINMGVANNSRITKMAWMYKFGRISDNFIHPDSTTCGIQEAIDDLELNYDGINPMTAGIIYIPKGIFNISTEITTYEMDGLIIQGAGRDNTILRIPDSHNNADFNLLTIYSDNVTIRGITLDGNSANQASGNYRLLRVRSNSRDWVIDDCAIKDIHTQAWSRLIAIRDNACHGLIHNCIFSNDGGGSGINFAGATNSNVTITNNQFYNVKITQKGDDCSITNNNFMGDSTILNTGSNNIIKDNIGYNHNSLFPFYEQNTAPTIADNCTAYWYDLDDDYMYQITNSYGTIWYINMTTTI